MSYKGICLVKFVEIVTVCLAGLLCLVAGADGQEEVDLVDGTGSFSGILCDWDEQWDLPIGRIWG